jgi:uncharacterized protein YraI
LGALLFVLVAAAILLTAYLAVAGDDSKDEATSTTVPVTAATTVAKDSGPYRVTTGVNVRQGPGTKFATVTALESGSKVMVACVADGEVVQGSGTPSTKWLKLAGTGPQGYVTAVYVETGDDLRTNKIPVCPPG